MYGAVVSKCRDVQDMRPGYREGTLAGREAVCSSGYFVEEPPSLKAWKIGYDVAGRCQEVSDMSAGVK